MDILERFMDITKVPRPSGHLGQIQNYLLDFAESNIISMIMATYS